MEAPQRLPKNRLFNGLQDIEAKSFLTMFKGERFGAGQYVFKEGDTGNSLFIVQKGVISLAKQITTEVDKKLAAARDGMIFGEFSFMDEGERSASAKAEEDSVLLALNRPDFNRFVEQKPAIGLKIYNNLLEIVVERLRRTNDAYRDAVRWGLEITGTQKLNFHYLITENVDIRIELISGKVFEGKVLQLERSDAGFELILVNKLGKLAIIPYHAVVSATLAN
jgi:CRP-like cAMP-binding protein